MTDSDREVVGQGIGWLLQELEGSRFGKLTLGVVVHQGRVTRLIRSIEDQPFDGRTLLAKYSVPPTDADGADASKGAR